MRPRARRHPHGTEEAEDPYVQPDRRPRSGHDARHDPGHPVDEKLPARRLVPAALQHVASMYAGLAAPPLIIGGALGLSAAQLAVLLSANLLLAGLATIAQSLDLRGFGSRLPLTNGVTFAVVSPVLGLISTDPDAALPAVFGSSLVAGLACVLLAPAFTRLVRFFPPLVSGCVITLVGLSLLPVAGTWARGGDPDAADFGSGSNLALAFGTLAVTLLLHRLLSGRFLGRVAVLLGMAVGTLIAVPLGKVDTGRLTEAPLFALPEPFAFGAPQFEATAVATMLVIMLVSMTESMASLIALGAVADRPADGRTIAGSLRAQGAATALGSVFGAFMVTTYAQNVGLVALSRLRSRYVVTCCGVILLLMGFVPVLGSLVALVPMPVLGGAGVVFFGSVAVTGFRTLAKASLGTGHNGLIVSVTFALGLFPIVQPDFYARLPEPLPTVLGSGITAGFLVAVLLNHLLNHRGRGTEADEDRTPAGPEHQGAFAHEAPYEAPYEASYGARYAPSSDPSWSAFVPRPQTGPDGFPPPAAAPTHYPSVDPDAVRAAFRESPAPDHPGPQHPW